MLDVRCSQIPADNWAYTILHSLLPDFVKLQLPVHRILYVSGQHACWLHLERPKAACNMASRWDSRCLSLLSSRVALACTLAVLRLPASCCLSHALHLVLLHLMRGYRLK